MQYAAGAPSAKLGTGYVDQLAAIGAAIASMGRTAWCYDCESMGAAWRA